MSTVMLILGDDGKRYVLPALYSVFLLRPKNLADHTLTGVPIVTNPVKDIRNDPLASNAFEYEHPPKSICTLGAFP